MTGWSAISSITPGIARWTRIGLWIWSRNDDGDSHRDPFSVDTGKALDALALAWGDEYDEISVLDGEWGAHRKDAPDRDVITGSTPDELNCM